MHLKVSHTRYEDELNLLLVREESHGMCASPVIFGPKCEVCGTTVPMSQL